MTDARAQAYEAIEIGTTATMHRRITREDVDRFVELTGDDNPLHVDRAYAEASPYKDIVVHGMLGAAFLSTLIGTRLPGEGAVWVSQAMTFVTPIRIDDTLTLVGTVRRKHDRDRLLELEMRIENQRGDTVLTGEGTVKVLRAPEPTTTAEGAPSDVALVAGGSGGIGRAVCRALSREGHPVAIAYQGQRDRAEVLVDELNASGGRAVAVDGDIADPNAVARMVDQVARSLGPVGILVHCASRPIQPASLDALTWQSLGDHLDTDVKGAFLLAQACVPHMRAQRFGRIVAVTSGVLDSPPTPRWTAYAVGKAALATFARALAVELGPDGITVNCVSPGLTETRLIGDLPEKLRLVLARQTPLRRLGQPEDVAEAVAFLVSSRAGYITGETIRVNGGQTTL